MADVLNLQLSDYPFVNELFYNRLSFSIFLLFFVMFILSMAKTLYLLTSNVYCKLPESKQHSVAYNTARSVYFILVAFLVVALLIKWIVIHQFLKVIEAKIIIIIYGMWWLFESVLLMKKLNKLQWIHHIVVVLIVFYFAEITDPPFDENNGEIRPALLLLGVAFIYLNIMEPLIFIMRYLNFSKNVLFCIKKLTIMNILFVYVLMYIAQIWMVCDYIIIKDWFGVSFTVIISVCLDLVDLKMVIFHWKFDVNKAVKHRDVLIAARSVNIAIEDTKAPEKICTN
eukprot:135519_1